jgi:hypothetical protein
MMNTITKIDDNQQKNNCSFTNSNNTNIRYNLQSNINSLNKNHQLSFYDERSNNNLYLNEYENNMKENKNSNKNFNKGESFKHNEKDITNYNTYNNASKRLERNQYIPVDNFHHSKREYNSSYTHIDPRSLYNKDRNDRIEKNSEKIEINRHTRNINKDFYSDKCYNHYSIDKEKTFEKAEVSNINNRTYNKTPETKRNINREEDSLENKRENNNFISSRILNNNQHKYNEINSELKRDKELNIEIKKCKYDIEDNKTKYELELVNIYFLFIYISKYKSINLKIK